MPNLNNVRPGQEFARLIRDHFLTFKDTMLESSKQQDSIAVWLVGMSTGSIALIISQFGKFNPLLYTAMKIGISFLTATIVCGLLFRILHLFLQEQDRQDQRHIYGWLTGYSEFSSKVPVELPEDASSQFIAWCLYEELGMDMDPEYLKILEDDNDVEYWRNQYKEHTEQALALQEAEDQDVKNMIEVFYQLLARLEGLPPQKFKQNVENDDKSSGIRKRRLKKSCKFFYILMCLCFAVSVLFISCSFIATDYKVSDTSATATQKKALPSEQVQSTQINKTD